jgi:hydrogenase expression/formation protein HypC
MCLALPSRIISIDGHVALTDRDGLKMEVDVSLLPEAKPGDEIIVHVGVGLAIVEPEDADFIRTTFEADAAAQTEDKK